MVARKEQLFVNSGSPTLKDLVSGRLPNDAGRYGAFGGRFVPELLMPALIALEKQSRQAFGDNNFQIRLETELKDWVGRPTPLTHARGLSDDWHAQVYLKREDLAHTGAHKINNALGQAMLAQSLGARRIIAETGAGQHGVAAAAACARLQLPCTVYMGVVDIERQAPNVDRMQRLGATVIPVATGDRMLRAAIDEALRDWVSDPDSTYYLIGSVVGPHPYPFIVRKLQCVIGREARGQTLEQTGRLPDAAIACVGGGSNAIGLFFPFLSDDVELVGIEAGGIGLADGAHAATINYGRPGVLHGSYSRLLQDENGQVMDTHSISAGLDYPGVGPEHSFLHSIGRVRYETATDREALSAFAACCSGEGIIPALESSHALAGAKRYAKNHPGTSILVGLSGRGDKDLPALANFGDAS